MENILLVDAYPRHRSPCRMTIRVRRRKYLPTLSSQVETLAAFFFQLSDHIIDVVFILFDENGDGFISKEELKLGLEKLNTVLNDKEVEEVFYDQIAAGLQL